MKETKFLIMALACMLALPRVQGQNLVVNGDVAVGTTSNPYPYTQAAPASGYNPGIPVDGAINGATGWSKGCSTNTLLPPSEGPSPDVLSPKAFSCSVPQPQAQQYCTPTNRWSVGINSASGDQSTGYIAIEQRRNNGLMLDEHARVNLNLPLGSGLDGGCYMLRFAASPTLPQAWHINKPQVEVLLTDKSNPCLQKLIYTSGTLGMGYQQWNYFAATVSISGADINKYDKLEFRIKYMDIPSLTEKSVLIDDVSLQKEVSSLAIATSNGTGAFCFGGPYTFNSTIVNNAPITNHVWIVAECNAGGTVIGPETWSPWSTGTPGSYTIPASFNVQAGHYYLVKLAVQTACDPWIQVARMVYIRTCFAPMSQVVAPVGIAGTAAAGEALLLYPNPARGIITAEIAAGTTGPEKLILTDITGKTLRTINIEQGKTRYEIDLSNYDNGIYCWKLWRNGHAGLVQKMVLCK